MPSSNNNNNSNNSAETALSPSEFRAFTLEKKEQIGDHIWCFQFAFPQHAAHLPSGLKTGEYICVRATIRDKPIIRYYSPISTPHDKGHISLMIKIDSSGGEMSWFLRDMKLGDTLEFKGPMGGHQYNPEKYKKYGLIAGGTGVSPMIQMFREIASSKDKTEASLLYGAVTVRDLVFAEEFERICADPSNNVRAHFTVDCIPDDGAEKDWKGSVGYITKDMIQQHMPPPGPETIILMCGPRKMIESLRPMLEELRYTKDNIFVYG